jgi:hypothetical protein
MPKTLAPKKGWALVIVPPAAETSEGNQYSTDFDFAPTGNRRYNRRAEEGVHWNC